MQLLIEEHERRQYPSVWNARPGLLPVIEAGETWPLTVGVMRRIKLPWDSRIFTPIDLADWTIQAAVGGGFILPFAGTFPLTFTAADASTESTVDIGYNPSVEELSDALNNLVKIIAVGGVTVQGADGFFQITFNNVGVRNLLTGNASELTPLSILDIQRVVTGTVSVQEVQTLRITQNVGSIVTLSTASAAASASVATVQTGTASLNHKVRVTLPDNRYGGTWTYTSASVESQPIGWDDSAEQIERILEAISGLGTGNVSVEQETEHEFLITYIGARALTAIVGISVSGTNLKVISTKSGTLDLRTVGVEALLNGAPQKVVSLEIEGTSATGLPQKLLKQAVLLTRPVIERASVAPTIGAVYYTQAQVDAMIGDTADLNVSTAATTDLAPASAFMQWFQRVIAATGAGVYTHKLTLDTSKAKDGAIFRVAIQLPASGNPTVEIYDNTIAGTMLERVNNITPGVAVYYLFEAIFDGTNWKKLDGHWLT